MNRLQQAQRENIFCIEKHPDLGLILQMQSVEKLGSGQFSMNYQKIRSQNADFYGLNDLEKEVLVLTEFYEGDKLLEKFYKGRAKVKTSEFFSKYLTAELKDNEVRPFIEKYMSKALHKLKGHVVYYWGKGNVNLWLPLYIPENPAQITFMVDRIEGAMHYSLEVQHDDKVIKLQHEDNAILINSPAWFITTGKLLYFDGEIEGKKFQPFFSKKNIVVPNTTEETYLNKFILPISEEHSLKTTGIELIEKKAEIQPIISLFPFESELNIGLKFRYNDKEFYSHHTKKSSASLKKGSKDWEISILKRDPEIENSIKAKLNNFGLIEKQGSVWALPPKVNIADFLRVNVLELIELGFEVDQDNLKKPFNLTEPILTYSVSESNDWFDLNIKVRFGTYEVPFKKLIKNIQEGNRFYELPDGTIAILPQEWLEKLPVLLEYGEESKDSLKIGKFHYPLLEEFDQISVNRSGSKLKSLISSYKKNFQIEQPKSLKATLRKYQVEGLRWLWSLHENKFGGLLADDMGLGKTIQTLAFFEALHQQKNKTKVELTPEQRFAEINANGGLENIKKNLKTVPFIVVAPTSLVFNWINEINKFTGLNAFVYAGNQRNRYVWEYFNDFDVIITTYGTIRNDMDVLNRMKFGVAVFDEAQNLKNPASATAKACFDLNAKQKILLTGTPIENSTLDLWSLMNVANPGMLGSFSKFSKNYGAKIEKEGDESKIKHLQSISQPFILRRTKEQVAKELPPRIEQTIYCEMEAEQSSLYEKTKSHYRNEIFKTIQDKGLNKSRLHVLKGLLKLRQLSNHPRLLEDNSKVESAKFIQIKENLLSVLEAGNKVLIFSQFVSHLKLFREELNKLQIPYAYLDGSVTGEEREHQVKLFQETEDYPVFLISLKAGGVGLNLTKADYVFLADPWWNPAVERQAMDRAHRIGREKTVFVYKFITVDSVEEKIAKLQEKKKILAGNIISDENAWLSSIDQSDIEDILN